MNMLKTMSGWTVGLLSSFWWLTTSFAQSVPPDSVRHRVILIGDAGRLRGGKNPVVDVVQSRYSFNDPRTTLIYLGDNVYPYGLSDETNPRYNAFVETLRYQVRPGRSDGGAASRPLDGSGTGRQSSANLEPSSPGRVLFIPGNHDWAQGKPDGWDNIRRQGRWLDSLNAPNIRLLPADGCPGPEEILLTDKLVLVILDSQWWLHHHDKPGLESDCADKTEVEVVARLVDIANRHKDKGVIVATHHPFRSYGI
ncbi:MAG: metallophosphoesterase, partial [Bacteroidetes bacterium]|nr:metallophosphoesterase [Fibrella sp.]